MSRFQFGLALVAILGTVPLHAAEPLPAQIRGSAGGSEIVITVTDRLAWAIDSLTWNGVEFIDSFDHGRQLQSASNFDAGRPFVSETFNPTEAGSRSDGTGPTSTSKLLKIRVREDKEQLQTTTQMAFWLRPGQKSAGHLARNTKPLSDHLLSKRVQIGHGKLDNVIEYDVTFRVPDGKKHTYAQFEALTGYMPPRFAKFWKYVPDLRDVRPLEMPNPGEQRYPVVFSTIDGSHAMGVYSPDQPSAGFAQAGYGQFRFPAAKVVKWNCVFRVRDKGGIKPGEYSYRMFVAVGKLPAVVESIASLHDEFNATGSTKSDHSP